MAAAAPLRPDRGTGGLELAIAARGVCSAPERKAASPLAPPTQKTSEPPSGGAWLCLCLCLESRWTCHRDLPLVPLAACQNRCVMAPTALFSMSRDGEDKGKTGGGLRQADDRNLCTTSHGHVQQVQSLESREGDGIGCRKAWLNLAAQLAAEDGLILVGGAENPISRNGQSCQFPCPLIPSVCWPAGKRPLPVWGRALFFSCPSVASRFRFVRFLLILFVGQGSVVRGNAPPMQAVMVWRERVPDPTDHQDAQTLAKDVYPYRVLTPSSPPYRFRGRVEAGWKLSSRQAGVVAMIGKCLECRAGPVGGARPRHTQPLRQSSSAWGPRCCVTASPKRSLAIRSRHCAGQFCPDRDGIFSWDL